MQPSGGTIIEYLIKPNEYIRIIYYFINSTKQKWLKKFK